MFNCSNKDSKRQISKNEEQIFAELKVITKDWQLDSTGCNNLRKNIIEDKLLNYDSLVGLNVRNLVKYLGLPNSSQIIDGTTSLVYFVSCKYAPLLKVKINNETQLKYQKVVNTEAKLLVIKYNIDSIITDINCIQP
jgi:hypothetical protein